jgi:hypothetical protein
MSYNWKDYYELGKRLGEDASENGEALSDAMYRSSISRAYYSAYNLALVYAESLGYVYPGNTGRHEALTNFFSDRTDADSASIAMLLATCKDFRRVADYNSEIPDDYHELSKIKDQTITRVETIFPLIGVQ